MIKLSYSIFSHHILLFLSSPVHLTPLLIEKKRENENVVVIKEENFTP